MCDVSSLMKIYRYIRKKEFSFLKILYVANVFLQRNTYRMYRTIKARTDYTRRLEGLFYRRTRISFHISVFMSQGFEHIPPDPFITLDYARHEPFLGPVRSFSIKLSAAGTIVPKLRACFN